MTTPDEVLAVMCEAMCFHEDGCACCDGKCQGAENARETFAAIATAALTAAKYLGWQLVPVAATEEMIEEGCGIDCTRTVCKARLECRDEDGRATMRERWDAMLAVVPKVVE